MKIFFEHHHAAMLLKYSGISFISGAVNHGFFSGERSLWTAAAGMVLFVVGAVMEHRLTDRDDEPASGLMRTLILGALLSIGLGFFTGGLQHFPDSPARSAWVVPLGFVISVPALAMSGSVPWRVGSGIYAAVAGVVISVTSYAAWQWFERHPEYVGAHALGHDHGGGQGHAEPTTGLTALRVDRSIEIRMNDTMRFSPDTLEVREGETVRLSVHNDGKLPHELVLGTDQEIREHAEQMKGGASSGHHDHAGGAAIELAPGQSGELVVRFGKAATLQIACLVPGHYEAGMKGAVRVTSGPARGASERRPLKQPAAHDHSTHKH